MTSPGIHSTPGDRPFAALVAEAHPQAPLRGAITQACRLPEPEVLAPLLEQARLPASQEAATRALAARLAGQLRREQAEHGHAGRVQGLLQEFALSSQEGVALMCLAEALLRIPDARTRDMLIRDKLQDGDWQAHIGHSRSLFVNAAAWGLLITGRLVADAPDQGLAAALTRLLGQGGEPLIRRAMDAAMRLLGEQFVAGRSIEEALAHAQPWQARGFRHSYDMLGEAALTAEDARRYRQAYERAIHAIGRAADGRGVRQGPGISIKLSALHPRYSRAQRGRVMTELYPVLRALACLAHSYDIGLNIDAEEADRLELSLDLLERLCFEPELAGWEGIGFVVQAYQKRAMPVIEYLIDLARRSEHRLMVRLVKGAYWDSEIKRTQVDGLDDYPVFTRKPHTDIAYLACARRLLSAPQWIYPQFATHNARTLAAVYHLAGPDAPPERYEFQCLHGMGEALYGQVVGASGLNRPCRIYAPVGSHETLLAYLVRRLLENGANTSFVNRIADPAVPLDTLLDDPVARVERDAASEGRVGLPHPQIPLPRALYRGARLNSRGLDLASEQTLAALGDSLAATAEQPWQAAPSHAPAQPAPAKAVTNPARRTDRVGAVVVAGMADVDRACAHAMAAAPGWAARSPQARASQLEQAALLMEANRPGLLALLVREAGKTYASAVAEVREATDFLRYYASLVSTRFDNHTHRPLGPVVCISPWNFPLAIFTGQLAAALAAGNVVLAKPAEQTPLVAALAVDLLHAAGIPRDVLQLLPGPGESVGDALVSDPRVRGVMFTGSTAVARQLQQRLAGRLDAQGRLPVLIAETGGLNAMIVDSSALPEQVVQDVLSSAFDSAGQRCSALRLLCLQDDIAEPLLAMLRGAMAELRLGDPQCLATDVGPLIDDAARAAIQRHIDAMAAAGHRVFQAAQPDDQALAGGSFLQPTLIELDQPEQLTREVFGPVLHVVRYQAGELDALVERINAAGYGLTMGVHSRLDSTLARVEARARVGNLYVNRNMVGAVVGVQPFGGEGLSGTGPKAGGPLYLYRLLAERPAGALHEALRWADGLPQALPPTQPPSPALQALLAWAQTRHPWLVDYGRRLADETPGTAPRVLVGPTGERNSYRLLPREAVLCLATSDEDRLTQLAMVLAVNSRALWPGDAPSRALQGQLPATVRARVGFITEGSNEPVGVSVALAHGEPGWLCDLSRHLAAREGPLIRLQGFAPGERPIGLEALLLERAVSINTAAAGGNASLMSLG